MRSDGIGIHKCQIPQAFLMGLEGAKLGNRHSYGVELRIITKLQTFEKSKQLQTLPSPPRWSMTKHTLGEVETKQKQIRPRTWLDLALNSLCVLSTTMEFLVRIQEEQLWKLQIHVTAHVSVVQVQSYSSPSGSHVMLVSAEGGVIDWDFQLRWRQKKKETERSSIVYFILPFPWV